MAAQMGLPQSYEAQKNVINLAQKQYVEAYRQEQKSNAEMKKWKDAGVDIDNTNLGDQQSIDVAVSKYISVNQGVDKITAENELNSALEERIRTSKEVISAEKDLNVAMKTWREGWMDAMAEEVIGAGDFAAVIGIGGRNVSEKTAAGGFSTARHGGTNKNDMNQSDLFAIQNQQATTYTPQLGKTFGSSANQPSALITHSDMLDDPMGDPAQATRNAQKLIQQGVVPVIPESSSQAIQAHADAMAGQTVANGTNASRSNITPVGMQTGDLINASAKQLGVDQPGLESQRKNSSSSNVIGTNV